MAHNVRCPCSLACGWVTIYSIGGPCIAAWGNRFLYDRWWYDISEDTYYVYVLRFLLVSNFSLQEMDKFMENPYRGEEEEQKEEEGMRPDEDSKCILLSTNE